MLKIPAIRKIGDVTVYQDDAVWYRFYLLPSMPSIRRDQNGRPVFLLASYHVSDQERAENPELPRGGGFMNFDVQFAVDEETTERARTELQQWVEEEYARRRGHRQFSRLREYADSQAPTVELADPLLSGGTVKMQTTQSDLLVTDRFAEAPASLVSGSTAVFNMDLTALGAEFMKDLMVDTDGTGRIDLTPVQVIYDLRMWARTPPILITVTGQSKRVHKTLLKISETNRDNPCTPREVETFRESGVNSSTLRESGDVKVQIDKGDATVPDEIVEALQDYALDLFDTMIEERFLVPAEGDDENLEFDSDDQESQDRDPGWAAVLYDGRNYSGTSLEVDEDQDSLDDLKGKVSSVRVRPGHRVTLYRRTGYGGQSKQISSSMRSLGGGWDNRAQSAKVWRPPTSRYKVRKTVNYSTMKLEIKIDRSQVVEWPLVAQATLATFFSGASADEIGRHVVELFPNDFDTLGVTVMAMVAFETSPFQAVEIQLKYSAKADNGEEHTTNAAFTFRAGEMDPQRFDPAIIGGKHEYEHRYRIFYDDGGVTEYTPWEMSTNRALNISIVDPGRLELEVSSAALNWEILRGITVKLSYSDPDRSDPLIERTFELTELVPTRKWEHGFKRELLGAVDIQTTYFLKDDKVVEAEPQKVAASENLFVVPPPQVDVLNVSLVPTGDWSDVAQAVVSLEYDAGNGQVFDRTYRFAKVDDFAEWQVLLRDPTRRTFRYKTLVTYKNGQFEDSQWHTETGDQAIPIKVKGVPKLRVNILSNLVDFTRTPAVTVSLTYGGEGKTLSFTDSRTASWEVPLDVDGSRNYTYEITWHPTDGNPIRSGLVRTADTELFIPKAKLVTPGKLEVIVRGFAVDFANTPFVDVTLTWVDGDREERKTLTLHENQKNMSWSVDVGDRAQRTYSYEVVYNLADGRRIDGPSGQSDDPVVSITPYQTA
ncbi:peptidase inhibitor family I36 protein [Thiocapsa bogorovii]|uniref:peptidase inhibitor family I36 protein n=1 Tax=Thiocapsa bogorovii TaxID=521689 RepID=UPI001E3B11EE|nr:peptidase inhibitor family I36 protein [Thiocapsa bogorovii]UHD15081.1 peptidase inhibitor family I36 protein [Thiocapsa bogorovii]